MTLDATAIVPACRRKVRRDQSGEIAPDRASATALASAVFSRNDSVWIPTSAATTPTIIAVVGLAAGESNEARKPSTAKTTNPAAATVNDQRTAAQPRIAPIATATARISVSSASLSFVPNRPTTRSLAPGG